MAHSVRRWPTAPPFDTFVGWCLTGGEPCIIGGLADDWPACREWVQDNAPAWEHLETTYGALDAPIVESSPDSDEKCSERRFSDVLAAWRTPLTERSRIYAKDWHLAATCEREGRSPFYSVPALFTDDWLNESFRALGRGDFRFVYIGEDKTRTCLHRDVYGSHSWSTNVLGDKEWTLFPPHTASWLREGASERPSAQLIPSVVLMAAADAGDSAAAAALAKFPRWRDAWADRHVVRQHARETIVVPSGWLHEVSNESPLVISINHNWADTGALLSLANAQAAATADAEHELRDVREMMAPDAAEEFATLVDRVVAADAGWSCVQELY